MQRRGQNTFSCCESLLEAPCQNKHPTKLLSSKHSSAFPFIAICFCLHCLLIWCCSGSSWQERAAWRNKQPKLLHSSFVEINKTCCAFLWQSPPLNIDSWKMQYIVNWFLRPWGRFGFLPDVLHGRESPPKIFLLHKDRPREGFCKPQAFQQSTESSAAFCFLCEGFFYASDGQGLRYCRDLYFMLSFSYPPQAYLMGDASAI